VLWATADPPHIIVGNPTSLLRLVDAGKLRLNAVDTVVVDEVDACLIEHHTRQELHNLLTRHLSNTYTTAENGKQASKLAVRRVNFVPSLLQELSVRQTSLERSTLFTCLLYTYRTARGHKRE
jgi:hypothetical protein